MVFSKQHGRYRHALKTRMILVVGAVDARCCLLSASAASRCGCSSGFFTFLIAVFTSRRPELRRRETDFLGNCNRKNRFPLPSLVHHHQHRHQHHHHHTIIIIITMLQPFLPDRPVLSYNLRRRPHCNKSLITKTVDLSNNDYIIRVTYKDSY